MDKLFEDLVGNTKQRYWAIAQGSSIGLLGFWIATTSSLLQILGILNRRKHEERKPHNQDFRAAPALSISSGKIQLGLGALPGFSC